MARKGCKTSASNSSISKVPATFKLFQQLPKELRDNVWRNMCDTTRVIEMQNASGHGWATVAAYSRAIPTVLHVNYEARQIGLKNYQVVKFDYLEYEEDESPIYFNPKRDIVYFGRKSCLSTMQTTFAGGKAISKVAVDMDLETGTCCGGLEQIYDLVDVKDLENSNLFSTLHGCYPATRTGHEFDDQPGCKGLTNVFINISSNLWQLEKKDPVPMDMYFRPAATNGLARKEIDLAIYLRATANLIKDGAGFTTFRKNRWTGSETPKFHFVSLTNPCSEREAYATYDAVSISNDDPEEIRSKKNYEINTIIRSAGCRSVVGKVDRTEPSTREIGMAGSAAAVAKAKRDVLEFFGRSHQIAQVTEDWKKLKAALE